MAETYSVVSSDGRKYKVIFIPAQMRELNADRGQASHDDSTGEMGFIWRNLRLSTNVIDLRQYKLLKVSGVVSYWNNFSTESGITTYLQSVLIRAGFNVSQIQVRRNVPFSSWNPHYSIDVWVYALKRYTNQQILNSAYNTLVNTRSFPEINLFI